MATLKSVFLLVTTGVLLAWVAAAALPCPQHCECQHGTLLVNCSRLSLTSVPRGIPVDVQQLILENNNIAKISRSDFRGLTALQFLDLSSNQLDSHGISTDAFADLPSLRTLDLSYNTKFVDLPAYLPSQLTTLYFTQNSVIHVRKDAFANLTDLVHLDISYNGVESIAPGAFQNLSNLSVLYCDFNKLKDDGIPPSVFKPASKLSILGLRFNQLTRVPVDIPAGLEHLDLVGNQIVDLPSRVFSNLTQLQTLEIWHQPSLTTIDDDAFAGLGKLQILDATSTGLNKVTNRTFDGLSGAWEVYLSLNKIPAVPAGAFHAMRNLSSLWLDANLINTLSPEVLDASILPRLSEVYLWGNPWTCDCHLRWLKEHIDNNNTAPTIDSPHLNVCSAPLKLKGRAFDSLSPKDFVCG
ncbi:platelet glycoprotein V-like [Branchiostoma lanceolatum]|uniref:platelet glycoprotein V-like n=1 Tax=Branchiostoma lanceolatum TaxID=7740 RepID=UPI0034555B4A